MLFAKIVIKIYLCLSKLELAKVGTILFLNNDKKKYKKIYSPYGDSNLHLYAPLT